jgi:transcriptional regulator with XRE-family HTH domain
MELKLRRIGSRVTGRALASEMGVGASRISAIEREAYPTPETERRYLAALERLTDVTHVQVAS